MNNGTDGTSNMKITAGLTDSRRVPRRTPGSSAGSVTVPAPQPGQPPQLFTVVRNNDGVDGNQSGCNISVHEGPVANQPNVLGTITIGHVPEQHPGVPHVPNGTPQRPTGTPDPPNHIPQRPTGQPIPSTFQITVQNHGGKPYYFDVRSSDSVDDLMRKIADEVGVPCEQQRLVYAGKNLNSGMSLRHYNIQEGSKLFLTLRLRGG